MDTLGSFSPAKVYDYLYDILSMVGQQSSATSFDLGEITTLLLNIMAEGTNKSFTERNSDLLLNKKRKCSFPFPQFNYLDD